MSTKGEFFRPIADKNGAVLVRPYTEAAFRSNAANMASLSVEVQPHLHVQLSDLALSATVPPGQNELSRATASLVMSEFTRTVLEIAVLKLADNLGIDYEQAYGAVFDGEKHAPLASSLFSSETHPLVQIDRLMEPFLNGGDSFTGVEPTDPNAVGPTSSSVVFTTRGRLTETVPVGDYL